MKSFLSETMYTLSYYIGAVVLAESFQFGIAEVTTDILMDSVGCLGTEQQLIDCDYDDRHNCYHYEDTGIHCGQKML